MKISKSADNATVMISYRVHWRASKAKREVAPGGADEEACCSCMPDGRRIRLYPAAYAPAGQKRKHDTPTYKVAMIGRRFAGGHRC